MHMKLNVHLRSFLVHRESVVLLVTQRMAKVSAPCQPWGDRMHSRDLTPSELHTQTQNLKASLEDGSLEMR